MKKVAVIESTHWHAPLYYGALEEREDVQVVGVSDSTGLTGKEVARRFGCRAYDSTVEMLDHERPDFAFVFGRHIDMPALADALIERRIPFAIEKPCGLRTADVRAIRHRAEATGLYVAVPFIFRLSDTLAVLGQAGGALEQASFRFIAGPPQRYLTANVPWMLDPSLAGGGPFLNLGVHFIDLFAHLAGDPIVSVSAAGSSRMNDLPIEDVLSVRLLTAQGRLATIECGYLFPSDTVVQRDFEFACRLERSYCMSREDGILVRRWQGDGSIAAQCHPARFETDVYYPEFVRRVLDESAAGDAPIAGLADAERALAVVEAAYASAAKGGVPIDPRIFEA
jgi:predicted dehydrogenase